MDSPLPFVTVIVPIRNEAKFIQSTLTQLATQEYPVDRFEVIVADGLSTDQTPEIVRRLQDRIPNLRLVSNPRRLSSAARNLGIQLGRGDFFVIVDGHCDIGDGNYLKKIAAAFENSGADCLGRPQPLEIAGATPVQESIALARRSWFGHNPDSHIYSSKEGFVKASSVAVAYRRTVFDIVGGFDERFDACEDVEFNHRVDEAGLKCWFAPEIAVHYYPRGSLRGLIRQMSRYGHGRIRLAAKHPRSLTLAALAPMTFCAGMVACVLLGTWSVLFAVAFGVGFFMYVAALAFAVATLMRKPGRVAAKCWLTLVFPAIHFGFSWGSFLETLRQWPRLVVGERAFKPATLAHGATPHLSQSDGGNLPRARPNEIHSGRPEESRRAAA